WPGRALECGGLTPLWAVFFGDKAKAVSSHTQSKERPWKALPKALHHPPPPPQPPLQAHGQAERDEERHQERRPPRAPPVRPALQAGLQRLRRRLQQAVEEVRQFLHPVRLPAPPRRHLAPELRVCRRALPLQDLDLD